LKLSRSNIPNPIPASAKSPLIATLTVTKRSLVSMSARATIGSTLTLAERRRIAAISAFGKVARHNSGFVVTGSSRMMGCSGLDKLPVRARGGSGIGGVGVGGGTTVSGSRKYMHLELL
jgi:hypothetical protein